MVKNIHIPEKISLLKTGVFPAAIFVVVVIVLPVSAFAQDTTGFLFGGYMRSGFGVDGKGGPQDVFSAPLTDAKYRLGNEAEAYIEALFGYAFEDKQEARFETNLRLAFVTPTSKSNQFLTTTSVREAFVRARGIIRKKPGMAFWAGQRFYDRYHVQMDDYHYRDMSGFGGGFENLALGQVARFSLAFLGGSIDELSSNGSVRPVNQFVLNKTTLDLTLYDLDVKFGTLGITFALSNFHGDSIIAEDGDYFVESNTGWSAGIFHEVSFTGGLNRLHVFYGSGAAENYKAVISQPNGVLPVPGESLNVGEFRRFRVIDDFEADFSESFSFLGLLLYQQLQNGQSSGNRVEWFSGGIRPAYHFNRYFSLEAEIGADHTVQEGGEPGTLVKMTLAPEISPLNRILSRPALRVYFTYARWTDSWIGQVASGSFPDQNHGISAGIQMEVWW